MKKIVLAMLLVAAVTAVAQTAAAPAQPAPQQTAAPAPAAPQQKEIKDPAEHNAYLRDVYPLALAYLTPGPTEKDLDGIYFIARAANLAQGDGKVKIALFGKSKYNKYHGSEEGWSDVLALTATTTLPPANFTIK